MSNIDRLLEKLSKVKATGQSRWMASCPMHDDRKPSLSIRLTDDDRILLNCFAQGCGGVEIMQAVGLAASDLFEHPLTHEPPDRLAPDRAPHSDLVELIDHESLVVMMLAEGVLSNRAIGPEVFDRLAQAVRRIGWARDLMRPARARKNG